MGDQRPQLDTPGRSSRDGRTCPRLGGRNAGALAHYDRAAVGQGAHHTAHVLSGRERARGDRIERRRLGRSAIRFRSVEATHARCGRETARRPRCSDRSVQFAPNVERCRTWVPFPLDEPPRSVAPGTAECDGRLRRADPGRVKPCGSRRRRRRSRGSCSRSVWSAGSSLGRTRTPGRGRRGGR